MTSISRRPVLFGLSVLVGAPFVKAAPAAAEPIPPGDLVFRQAVAAAAVPDPAIATFYRDRDYAPLWTTSADAGRRAALFSALDRAADHGLPVKRYGAGDLRAAFAAINNERARGRLEVEVTRTLLAYARDVQTGFLVPSRVDAGIVRDVPLRDPLLSLRAFALSDPVAWLARLPPDAPEYDALRRAMFDLQGVIAAGGWGAAVPEKPMRPGDGGRSVVALRDRLIRMGYLGRTARPDYGQALEDAVRAFQAAHGLATDGVAGAATLAEINVGPEHRLGSVLVAMERMRWMNGTPLGARHIWVNLPDFTARIVDNGKTTFETVTVVGMDEADRRSPEFSEDMTFLVINPTWNVPRSISVKEYLPMLQKNRNAVSHLKIVDRRGRVVDRASIDFAQYSARNFPFRIKQPPAENNALGRVKFMFPNKWNIYLHDTPSKALFKKDVRAFSHGCIRLGKPFGFAYALLAPQTADPEGLFKAHLDTGGENTVTLKTPVPVHLVYFTAWPSARGGMEYRRDVYGRDARIFAAMQSAGVVMDEVQG